MALSLLAKKLLATLPARLNLLIIFGEADEDTVAEIEAYLEALDAEETWLCPYHCGTRVPYGKSCDDENCIANRPKRKNNDNRGLGISEISNE